MQYSEFRARSVFRASASCSRILNGENIFHAVYSVHIHLGVIPCYLGWCNV